jgi:hypothetical protein
VGVIAHNGAMRRVLLAATVTWLLVMLSMAAPRRVGDASEYVAMAGRLADLRAPTFSAADMTAFTAAWAATGTGFELQTRQLPELQGRDGRFDMPHMWLYPLLSVPLVWIARLLGTGDPWGLVALNVGMVASLLWLAARRGAGPWTLTLFASPIVWWLDKPLADLLVGCILGSATLLWPHPAALVLLGLGAAQNPALLVGCVIFGVTALVREPRRIGSRRWQIAMAVGAACAAIAPLYYLSRLDRLSPLTSFTVAAWPSLTSLFFPLADVNMGVLVRYPPAVAFGLVALAQRRSWRESAALPAALTAGALLLVISQQPNMNQGGNPDLSRYIVWLLPLAMPWLLALDRSPGYATRVSGTIAVAVAVVWTTAAFPLSRPESYRYPTPFGSGRGTRHGPHRASRRLANARRIGNRRSSRRRRAGARRCCCSRHGGRRTVRRRRHHHRRVVHAVPTAMPTASRWRQGDERSRCSAGYRSSNPS